MCYHTGTYGQVTGDHVHTCIGQGTWQGSVPRPPNNNYDLANRIHYWEGVYINNTVIIEGYGHNWQTWQEEFKPKRPFPFVLYAERLRNDDNLLY